MKIKIELNHFIYIPILISALLTIDYWLPLKTSEEIVLSVHTERHDSRSGGSYTIRMVKTNVSSFNSAEENQQCCIYDLEPIQVKRTFIFKAPYSYALAEDNFKTTYKPEVSFFYLYNLGNYLMLFLAAGYLLFKTNKYRIHMFVAAQLLLLCHLILWVIYY